MANHILAYQKTWAVLRQLAGRFDQGRGWKFLVQVSPAIGTRRGRRIADALAVGTHPKTAYELQGIEVKMSRGDWLTEMRHPEKSRRIAKYCNRWWLAVPDLSIVRVDELPRGVGLLHVRVGYRVEIIRDATYRVGKELDKPMLAGILNSVPYSDLPYYLEAA